MVYSMTSYATYTVEIADRGSLTWEIKSVNHRFLELSWRLPEFLRSKELNYREEVKRLVNRGKVDLSLRWSPSTAESFELNSKALNNLKSVAEKLEKQWGRELSWQGDTLLQWPGLITEGAAIDSHEIDDIFYETSLNSLRQTLELFIQSRQDEGNSLAKGMQDKVNKIVENVDILKIKIPDWQKRLFDKFSTKLKDIEISGDADRVAQEWAFILQKLDVAEELDRLYVHAHQFQKILANNDPKGRKLDFLLQEMNREANTLASKSSVLEQTDIAMELKLLVEQLREQIQNIE